MKNIVYVVLCRDYVGSYIAGVYRSRGRAIKAICTSLDDELMPAKERRDIMKAINAVRNDKSLNTIGEFYIVEKEVIK
jgi:uncharacterized membrane protein